MERRQAIAGISSAAGLFAACRRQTTPEPEVSPKALPGPRTAALQTAVLDTFVLGQPPWPTFDPFLFCVHHTDDYPEGTQTMAPAASLAGRNIGSDFAGKDGWRMYHGSEVPGFPRHPHRGFETVTVARRGFIDHSDSLGATARYGQGDVQWMTAGAGVVHAEMFPLIKEGERNPLELFQIWLNLPKADKFTPPHFSMLWNHTIPQHDVADAAGLKTRLVQVAGTYDGITAPNPPPHSWASRPEADAAIWTINIPAGGQFELPQVGVTTDRTLYFFSGENLNIEGQTYGRGSGLRLSPGLSVRIVNGNQPTELLLLQAKPIGEPIVQRGPFVMNTPQEIAQAYRDFRATEFGGWPWPKSDPVHDRTKGRFAIHADGRKETAS
jgi:quercetin 2,3-dioxygenase